MALRPLKERCLQFLNDLLGAESIDRLPVPPGHGQSKKADYFLENRRFICEVKSLETDTAWKVQQELNELMQERNWPPVFGRVGLCNVLAQLPDYERMMVRISARTSSSVGKAVLSANDQTKSTKAIFGVPAAKGVLVVLNGSLGILSPNSIYKRIESLLRRRDAQGHQLIAELDAIVVLSEAHRFGVAGNKTGVLIIQNPFNDGSEQVTAFAKRLMGKWAQPSQITWENLVGTTDFRCRPVRELSFRAAPSFPEELASVIATQTEARRKCGTILFETFYLDEPKRRGILESTAKLECGGTESFFRCIRCGARNFMITREEDGLTRVIVTEMKE